MEEQIVIKHECVGVVEEVGSEEKKFSAKKPCGI